MIVFELLMIEFGGLTEIRDDGGPEMLTPHLLVLAPELRPGNQMNDALDSTAHALSTASLVPFVIPPY